jgi:hypothetical protein
MSVLREDSPIDPQDPRHYAPRRTSPRAELRLSTVSAAVGETAFDRSSKPELVRRAPPPTSLSAELEHAVFQSLQRQMDPEIIPEPPMTDGRLWRRAWIGVGAAVAAAAIAATLLVVLTPHDDSGASLAAASSSAQDDATKPALAQFRALLGANNGDQTVNHEQSVNREQSVNHEQSDQLLQQFMQWRQKSDAGDQAR